MDRATQRDIIGRLLGLIEAGTTDMADDIARAPVDAYLAPERLARERAVLFRRYPLIVGHGSQVPESGDFLTHDAAGVPILVVRGEDGGIRAFLNVCRHRGTQVVRQASGAGARTFVCPYHAWSYGLDGRLLAIPHEDGFRGIDKERRGLVRLPAAERHGFVFVVPSPSPGGTHEIDVAAYLGPLDADFTAFGLDRHVAYSPSRRAKRVNWKLGIDIFLEGYHVKTTHSETIWPIFLDNVGLYDRFPPHIRTVFPKRAIRDLKGAGPGDWNIRGVANVLYVIFPNTLLLMEPDHFGLFHVFPDGPDGSLFLGSTLLPEWPADAKARGYWQKNIDILHDATEEDFGIGESIQAALGSGANSHLTFGRFEQALGWFHRHVDEALAAAEV